MSVKLILSTLLFVVNINYVSTKPSRPLLQLQASASPNDTAVNDDSTETLLINPIILTTDDNNNNEQTNIVAISLDQCICTERLVSGCIYLPFFNPVVLSNKVYQMVIAQNLSNCDAFMHSLLISKLIEKPQEYIQTYLVPLIDFDNSLQHTGRCDYAIQISFNQLLIKRSIHNDNDDMDPFVSHFPGVLLNDTTPPMFLNQYRNSLKAFLHRMRNWVLSGINEWFSSNQNLNDCAIKYSAAPLDVVTIMVAFSATQKYGLFSFIIMTMFSIDTAVAQQCSVSEIDYLGDGWCDDTGGYNSLECEWDKGDCCEQSCVSTVDFDCGDNGYTCLDPQYFTVSPTVSTVSPTLRPTHSLFSNDWIVSDTTLPAIGSYMAGGIWNGTISIFGGFQSEYYMEYNVHTDTLGISGSLQFSPYAYGDGQFYTQQQDQLFIIQAANDGYISLLNLSSKSYIENYAKLQHDVASAIPWPLSVYGQTGCLASTDEFLYVVGGYDYPNILDYLQILVLETLSWQIGPSLIHARGNAACVIAPNDYLFALGGVSTHVIERINTQNIFSNAWQEFGQLKLYSGQTKWDGRTAVVYGENILLIGGHMQIINTFTGFVEFGPAMDIPVVYAVVVVAHKTIYALGGRNFDDNFIDTIQYYILPETSPPTSAPTDSPTSFTTSPTTFPSASPTNPTTVPTAAPSNAPSLAPSRTPTGSTDGPSNSPSTPPSQFPSISPTDGPSNSPSTPPSQFPSFSPTQPPSKSPSAPPSQFPSFSPTQPPSTHPTPAPTYNPTTKNPTLHSTLNPSNRPTKFPTKATQPPTDSPIIAPSDAPTESPTVSVETMQYLQDLDDLEYLYQILLISFALLFGMISFLAWVDSTNRCRTNDYFKINQISAAAFQSLDMYSDCFFAVNVSIQNKLNSQYSMALIFSIIFIIVPASLTIGQLYYHSQKHWVYSSDKVRGWMSKRAKALYLLSMLTGNAFAAVSLVNSYMFQLSFFDMGLTDKEISAFTYKRVYTVILFENLPQLGIQAWYLYSFGALGDPITISSIIFSLISIIVSVLSMSVQKSLSQTEGHAAITLRVTGNEVMIYKKRCKTRKKKLEKKLAVMVGVDPSRVQVIKPMDIKNGFELNVNFYFLDVNKTPKDYYKILIDERKTGELQIAFKNGWKLDAEPIVDIISHEIIQSKNKRRRSEKIRDSVVETQETNSLQMVTVESKNKDPNNKSISLIDRTNGGKVKQTNTKGETVPRNDEGGYQE